MGHEFDDPNDPRRPFTFNPNPTAARCDALGPHPQESGSRAANLADARQAGVSGPCVGTHDVRQTIFDHPDFVKIAREFDVWDAKCLPDVIRDLPPHQQREWERYMNNKRDEVHVGDAASSERWAKQRAQYEKFSAGMPPMPQSAVTQDIADRISTGIIALINSQPRSPTKDEIAAVVTSVIGAAGTNSDFLIVSRETLENMARVASDAEVRRGHPVYKLTSGQFGANVTRVLGRAASQLQDSGLSQLGNLPGAPSAADLERQREFEARFNNSMKAADVQLRARAPFEVDPQELMRIGYLDQDGRVAAFAGIEQHDGPQAAVYQDPEAAGGEWHQYQIFAWKSRDLGRICARVSCLGGVLKARGVDTIVWRHRPEISVHRDVERMTTEYRFYCRFHCHPYFKVPGEKLQGDETPEA